MRKHGKDKIEIPEEIKNNVIEIVDQFNCKYSSRDDCFYTVRFQGKYCYLDCSDNGRIGPIFLPLFQGLLISGNMQSLNGAANDTTPTNFISPEVDI